MRKNSHAGRFAPFALLFQAGVEDSRNTGLAMVLICLLLAYWGRGSQWLPAAIALLLLCMAWPVAFRPLVPIWLGFSHLLGTGISRVILTLLFYGLVTPVGLLRRMSGADSMQRRQWKADNGSVLTTRNHAYQPEDLERPY